MSDLVLAAFAAETGGHVVEEPRERRFERFRREFDEAAFRSTLAARKLRFVGRSEAEYPSLLRELHDPPPGLFLRGSGAAELLGQPGVAIVGARACSSYGSQVARLLGRELSAAGLVVVSGLARGIDGEAHRGALEAGGRTVAVLGCGVDRDYPAAHAQLATRIGEQGLIVSEYAPGVEPAPWRFPARNRIIAGLAEATVVVEARERSGALITADFALEAGREVFAVPGEITSALSAGTNALLRLGATPLTSPEDVLEALGVVAVSAPEPELGETPARVLEALGREPSGIDGLIRETGLDAAAVATALAELELAGAVAEADGLYRGRGRRARIADIETSSYWLAEPRSPLAAPADRSAGPVDVAVVGGGVTGCACALRLAEAGKRVRLYEAREIAGGASGRNGGFALRGGAVAYDVARRELGAERARAFWVLTERYLDRLEQLAGDAFRRTGSLRLAADAGERAELTAEYEALREDGFAVEWRAELAQPLAGRFDAAIFHPRDGSLQPARWVRRLAALAVEAGAELLEHERVESIDPLEADQVVIATDGYTHGLVPELDAAIRPTRGQVLVTEPLERRLFPCPHYARHGYDYWRQAEDGRLVAGGFRDKATDHEYTAEEATTPLIQGQLERFVAELLGEEPRIDHRWAGIFGTTADRLPLVGRLPGSERVWVSAGYSGHGNVLGLACGELLAEAILGAPEPELELFDPARLLRG